jgi:hypothetical protein
MSDMSQPAEGAPSEAAAPETTPEPWAPVQSRVDELAGGMGELTSRFDQFIQSQQPEPDPEPDPWAALMGDPEPDPYQQQPTLDLQQLQQTVEQRIQQGIQAGLTPVQAELAEIRLNRASEQLGRMIPALADKPENVENRQQAFQLVQAALQNYSPEHANALSADPNFISTVWKAAEADRLAQGQAPAASDVPALEAAGGALPGGNGAQPDPVKSAYENAWQLPPGLR